MQTILTGVGYALAIVLMPFYLLFKVAMVLFWISLIVGIPLFILQTIFGG
jgi:hypothetical protein